MGEYVKLNGDAVKLGTCEDLYYTTYKLLTDNVHLMKEQPGNCKPREYLNPAMGWRYRFPFPDEDTMGICEGQEYDRGYRVVLPYDAQLRLDGDGLTHDEINVNIEMTGGTRFYLPCPWRWSEEEREARKLHLVNCLEIVQQKWVKGSLWTIIRCPLCRCKYRLEPEYGLWLGEYLAENGTDNDKRIATRMIAGYNHKEENCHAA